jgi:CRP/FNR family transcriptional regulator, cyclic AMP receptor protein
VESEAADAARYFMLKSLVKNEAFQDVEGRVLQELAEMASIAELAKGESIYEAGQRWEYVGFLAEGCVAMLAPSDESKERLYEQVNAGEFFGVASLFDGEPEMARTVVVSKRAVYALIDRTKAVELCKAHGTLAVAFAVTSARRVRHLTSLLASEMSLNAQQRIVRYLLYFAQGPSLAPARDPLPLMTQTQIAAAAGTVKEVVSRTLAALERQGAVKREAGHVRWLDRRLLAQVLGQPERGRKANQTLT